MTESPALILLNLNVRVRAFMSRTIESVEVGRPVMEAVKRMVEADIGSVLVTQNQEPIGIITERDILRRVVYARESTEKPVEEIMSGPLITVDHLATIGDAAQIMVERRVRRLLVKEDGRIVGIVTQRDLQKALAETFDALLLT